MIKRESIDGGNPFNWGQASPDYAKYRDIYPAAFYRYLLDQGLCTQGQRVLDIGTGTGVLPRNLAPYGAAFVGIDLSENQIAWAKRLAAQQKRTIEFICTSAEKMEFQKETFDLITACQCLPYLDHAVLPAKLNRILKPTGKFVMLYMAWLPYEDEIARQSEQLVLKYNPQWSGGGETRHFIEIPASYSSYFDLEKQEVFDLSVPFQRETWNGRMKACRGIGASLPEEKIALFEKEHLALLERIAPETFEIRHYAAVAVLKKREGNNPVM